MGYQQPVPRPGRVLFAIAVFVTLGVVSVLGGVLLLYVAFVAGGDQPLYGYVAGIIGLLTVPTGVFQLLAAYWLWQDRPRARLAGVVACIPGAVFSGTLVSSFLAPFAGPLTASPYVVYALVALLLLINDRPEVGPPAG